MSDIVVRGARQHNLKDVHVTIPRDKLVVVTGPSGSGKSSLAFDTIYAEGQRRYVESLSAYARQFLDQMPRPDVDTIEGLSPAISIEQQSGTRNPRSTVGTITETYDYLRLLYARVGKPHCPKCGRAISAQTVPQMVDRLLAQPEGTRIGVLAPIVRDRKGEFRRELAALRKDGFVRVRIDGEIRDLGEEIALDKARAHTIDVFVDRIAIKPDVRQRLSESIELALKLSDGLVRVAAADGAEELMSERFACIECGISLPELEPRLFSFNSPSGACPACGGLGEVRFFDPELVVPDTSLSIRGGAIAPWGKPGGAYHTYMVEALRKAMRVDLDKPWRDLSERMRKAILFGPGGDASATETTATPVVIAKRSRAERAEEAGAKAGFEGVIPGLDRRVRDYERRKREEGAAEEDAIEYLEEEFNRFATSEVCPECGGARLRREALAVTVGDKNIRQVTALSVREAARFFETLSLSARDTAIARRIVHEVSSRLRLLVDLGLDYLSIDRAAATLSGGELERIRLATQIGAGLVGVLYVLDEPSIGLHPRDNARLVDTLRSLRDKGNTVLVVEHDADTIRAADHVIDMGPGAGRTGGEVVATGSPAEIERDPRSLTGRFLSGARAIAVPRKRREGKEGALVVRNARTHNLRDVTVRFPLGVLACVTGVSGSGKSSLVVDTLLPAARSYLYGARAGSYDATIEGLELIERVVDVDQAPIGRTPRSNPATYTGMFTEIRDAFATLPDARARGYKPGRFSFNVKGGRCEACLGDGILRVEMHFLPDVYVQCEECRGARYNRETLEVRYRGHSIADVLALTVEEAIDLFAALHRIRDKLATLRSVGLGYLELGQSATTLSGGEAQRVKLSRELGRRGTGKTLYILDEPTTGLHFADVEVLLGVLQDLVDAGNTVVVIEHNLEIVKCADYVVDLGPEGGEGGGRVVATGTPEEIARAERSHTGRFLASLLDRDREREATRSRSSRSRGARA